MSVAAVRPQVSRGCLYGPSNEEISVLFFSPEFCTELLVKNTRNRRVAPYRVSALSRRLSSDWIFNGATIVVSKTGVLLDGQHRLKAAVGANVGFWGILVSNVEDEAQTTIDTGNVRNLATVLSLSSEFDDLRGLETVLAGQVSLLFAYAVRGNSNKYLTTDARKSILLSDERLLFAAKKCFLYKTPSSVLKASAAAVAHYLGGWEYPQETEEFMAAVHSGISPTLMVVGQPAYTLRQYLILSTRRAATARTAIPSVIVMRNILSALRKHILKEEVRAMKPSMVDIPGASRDDVRLKFGWNFEEGADLA